MCEKFVVGDILNELEITVSSVDEANSLRRKMLGENAANEFMSKLIYIAKVTFNGEKKNLEMLT